MASTSNQGPGAQREPHKTDEGGMVSAVRDKVEDVASSVAATAEEAWDSTRQGVRRVADSAGDAWGEVTGLMRRYPFGTLCVGIGVGFVLARLLEDRGPRDLRRLGSDLYDRVRDYASDVASKVRS
jgi:hypothetical protein